MNELVWREDKECTIYVLPNHSGYAYLHHSDHSLIQTLLSKRSPRVNELTLELIVELSINPARFHQT